MKTIFLVVLAVMILAQAVSAEIVCMQMDAPPEGGEKYRTSTIPPPIKKILPPGYLVLSGIPNLWWTTNCVATCQGMGIGYASNNGYPEICRKKIVLNGVANWVPYVFPTGGILNDNLPFLLENDSPHKYPSDCDLISTKAGNFGRGITDWGHFDDYVWTLGGVLPALKDPYINGSTPRTAHVDDCIADFMGTDIYNYRACKDGGANIYVDNSGAPLTWEPSTYPWDNIPRGPEMKDKSPIDAFYGLSRYVVWTGYWDPHVQTNAKDGTPIVHDVFKRSTQLVKGCKLENWSTIPPASQGATKEDVIQELESGYPVYLLVVGVTRYNDSTTTPPTEANLNFLHVIVAVGYNKQEMAADPSARLKMICYDTWNESDLSSLYQESPWRVIPFPTEAEAGDIYCHSFQRASKGQQFWKVYGICCFRIDDNPRCPDPLGANDYAEYSYDSELTINFNLGQGADHIHYDYGRNPTPCSPSLTLDTNGQASILIEKDCAIYFKAYKDAACPDGFLASRTVGRVFSIFGLNKNPKKFADGSQVTMVNGEVTWTNEDEFVFEERDKSLFGIRVLCPSHGMVIGDGVQIVSGTIQTQNDMRYVIADPDSIIKMESNKVVAPYGLTIANLGGSDYNPPGSTGIGHGQKGVTGGKGANNVGLLVKVVGKIVGINETYILVSDGSPVFDQSGKQGVRVYGSFPTDIAVGNIISITGISALEKGAYPSTELFPKILMVGIDKIQ